MGHGVYSFAMFSPQDGSRPADARRHSEGWEVWICHHLLQRHLRLHLVVLWEHTHAGAAFTVFVFFICLSASSFVLLLKVIYFSFSVYSDNVPVETSVPVYRRLRLGLSGLLVLYYNGQAYFLMQKNKLINIYHVVKSYLHDCTFVFKSLVKGPVAHDYRQKIFCTRNN